MSIIFDEVTGKTEIAVLCVKGHWADDIMDGRKPLEIRSKRSHYRGPLMIVKSQPAGWDSKAFGPGGRALGIVQMVNCREYKRDREDFKNSNGVPWTPKQWAWVMVKPQRFASPFPLKGRLGIFRIVVTREFFESITKETPR